MSAGLATDQRAAVLYVFVVGFHHKKGCTIEYSYPPLDERSEEESVTSPGVYLPEIWKTLPSLALPDGAHNYDRDTVFFHLPDPVDSSTVFGVSCYRQIPAEKLKSKSIDVTRGTVQKCVVVLSRFPLYGLIAAKCEMITHAYFGELDFSKVDCLKELYDNLNGLLTKELLSTSEVFLELSPRQLVLQFQHKVLILFKLLLLEKKVLFFTSPVKSLCTSILTLCSLLPGMIEDGGLSRCSSTVQPKSGLERKFSGDIELIENISPIPEERPDPFSFVTKSTYDPKKPSVANNGSTTPERLTETPIEDDIDEDERLMKEIDEALASDKRAPDGYQEVKTEPPRSSTPPFLRLNINSCGLPLEVFRKGSFCHPYLSLTYLDILSDVRVRGFVIGATNYLFKQKRNLFDVIVEPDTAKIDIVDLELKKQLSLSTEDLRFADYLVKNTMEATSSGSVYLDGTSWEGGDEWLRYQFKVYLLHLLRTSELEENGKEYSMFNSVFVNAWKETHNYKNWSGASHPGIFEVNPGHPFTGQLSMADMKLRLAHHFGSDKSKKIGQTASTTGKAVTGAVTSAKSAVSSWWTNWKSPAPAGADGQPPSGSNGTSKVDGQSVSSAAATASAAISGVASTLSSFSLSTLLKSAEIEEAKEMSETNQIESHSMPKAHNSTGEIHDV